MSELIDREALLDECLNHYEVGNIEQNCTMDWICKTVRNFPAAPRWHRVEDELPEPHEYVLCCGKKGGCFVGWTLDNADVVKANGHGRAFVHGGNARTFTHWMPIEPPKEDA